MGYNLRNPWREYGEGLDLFFILPFLSSGHWTQVLRSINVMSCRFGIPLDWERMCLRDAAGFGCTNIGLEEACLRQPAVLSLGLQVLCAEGHQFSHPFSSAFREFPSLPRSWEGAEVCIRSRISWCYSYFLVTGIFFLKAWRMLGLLFLEERVMMPESVREIRCCPSCSGLCVHYCGLWRLGLSPFLIPYCPVTNHA